MSLKVFISLQTCVKLMEYSNIFFLNVLQDLLEQYNPLVHSNTDPYDSQIKVTLPHYQRSFSLQ